MYEKKLAELQTQLHESSTASSSVSPSGPRQHKHITLEEEWEDQNRERLMNTVLLANQLVREANMLSEALNKDTLFRVTLTVSCYYGDRCHGDVYLCRVPACNCIMRLFEYLFFFLSLFFFFLFPLFFSVFTLSLSLSISLFPSSMYTFSSLLPPPFLPSSSPPSPRSPSLSSVPDSISAPKRCTLVTRLLYVSYTDREVLTPSGPSIRWPRRFSRWGTCTSA